VKRALSLALLVWICFLSTAAAENWPAWRGADGTGISSEQNLPVRWTTTENIRWKTPLPEPCNSTPVVWDDRVFLTQGLDGGARRALIALDRNTGEKLWQQELACTAEETTHRQNPPCSASPVTDGRSVYAYFGSAGVLACDLNGNQLWHRDLGPVLHHFGNGGSPVLTENLVILFHGPGEPSLLMALDKQSGATVWKSQETPINHNLFGSWGTPLLLQVRDHTELIMPLPGKRVGGVGWFKAYDPATGTTLWQCDGLGTEVYSMPVVGTDGKLVVGISGHNGPTMAVRPGGAGNVTSSRRLWRTEVKNPQRVGSGVIHDGHVYLANASPGTMECLRAENGESVWKERLGGNLWGSVLLAGGNLYVTSLEGDTFVVRASPQFELVSKNSIGETTYAALAPSNGELFLRTHEHLYCIADNGKN